MKYIIDIHSAPPCVVLVSEDIAEVNRVGQAYADQVRRDLVVAEGPRADEPSIRPTIAQAPPLEPSLDTQRVEYLAQHVVLHERLDRARAALKQLGLTVEEERTLARELE